jgi:hypothetical protein
VGALAVHGGCTRTRTLMTLIETFEKIMGKKKKREKRGDVKM